MNLHNIQKPLARALAALALGAAALVANSHQASADCRSNWAAWNQTASCTDADGAIAYSTPGNNARTIGAYGKNLRQNYVVTARGYTSGGTVLCTAESYDGTTQSASCSQAVYKHRAFYTPVEIIQ